MEYNTSIILLWITAKLGWALCPVSHTIITRYPLKNRGWNSAGFNLWKPDTSSTMSGFLGSQQSLQMSEETRPSQHRKQSGDQLLRSPVKSSHANSVKIFCRIFKLLQKFGSFFSREPVEPVFCFIDKIKCRKFIMFMDSWGTQLRQPNQWLKDIDISKYWSQRT